MCVCLIVRENSENDNSEVSVPVETGQKQPPHKKSKDTARDKHSGSSATQWITHCIIGVNMSFSMVCFFMFKYITLKKGNKAANNSV